MNSPVTEILHDLLVSPKNQTTYPSITIEYTPELYGDVMEHMIDYHMTGWTVCGAQDPAVVYLDDKFGEKYPTLSKYSVVRVIDRFLNGWKSETLLEFSNEDMTDDEYKMYEEIMEEEERK